MRDLIVVERTIWTAPGHPCRTARIHPCYRTKKGTIDKAWRKASCLQPLIPSKMNVTPNNLILWGSAKARNTTSTRQLSQRERFGNGASHFTMHYQPCQRAQYRHHPRQSKGHYPNPRKSICRCTMLDISLLQTDSIPHPKKLDLKLLPRKASTGHTTTLSHRSMVSICGGLPVRSRGSICHTGFR